MHLILDMAMDRLKQDENSWRQHFEDLPAVATVPKSDVTELEHLTQNFNLSTMSGIISGEVTVRYVTAHFYLRCKLCSASACSLRSSNLHLPVQALWRMVANDDYQLENILNYTLRSLEVYLMIYAQILALLFEVHLNEDHIHL